MILHPGARLLLYLLTALALPGLGFWGLLCVLLATLGASVDRMRNVLSLMRRARWLFLMLFIGYAWQAQGIAALPVLGDYSPSRAGLLEAGLHMLRLAVLLAVLDLLVLRLSRTELLGGLHAVLRLAGLPEANAERIAVRLALTLDALAAPSPPRLALNPKTWRDLLDPRNLDASANALPGVITLPRQRWSAVDALGLGAGVLALIGVLIQTWFNA